MNFISNPADGTRIAYRVQGAGEPLLLVHGSLLSHVLWRGFGYVKELRDRYQLILVDLRGHGRSDKPHDEAAYTIDLVASDLVALLDELNVEQTHYLGYSLGGRTGLQLAARAPERVHSLIVGAGSNRPQAGVLDGLFFPGSAEILATGGMDAFLEAWDRSREIPLDRATRSAFKANDVQAMVAYFRASDAAPGIGDDVMRSLDIPTLLFVGSEDVDRLADTEALARLIPGAELAVIPGFDHATALAASVHVLSVVRPFLAAHPIF